MSIWWRLHGTWDYFRGRTSWGKLERTGFQTAASVLLGICLLAAPTPTAVAGTHGDREAMAIAGVEDRRTGNDANWQEV